MYDFFVDLFYENKSSSQKKQQKNRPPNLGYERLQT